MDAGVVIVAHDADEHADAVQSELEQRRLQVCRISRATLPSGSLSWAPSGQLSVNGIGIGGAAGLWRRPSQADVASVAPEYAFFAFRESEDAFDGACLTAKIRWLSHPLAIHAAELKVRQLGVATELGISIPPTLVTNDSTDAVAFADEHGRVVAKPVRYGLVTDHPEPTVAWTTEVERFELAELRGPPVILQQRMTARHHFRVVTVGEDVFVSRLEATELDWRSKIENHEHFVAVGAASHGSLVRAAHELAAAFSLGYSAQDWIVDSQDRLWFLELNPSGQWLFVDGIHGGRITATIAERLAMVSQ